MKSKNLKIGQCSHTVIFCRKYELPPESFFAESLHLAHLETNGRNLVFTASYPRRFSNRCTHTTTHQRGPLPKHSLSLWFHREATIHSSIHWSLESAPGSQVWRCTFLNYKKWMHTWREISFFIFISFNHTEMWEGKFLIQRERAKHNKNLWVSQTDILILFVAKLPLLPGLGIVLWTQH